jgi:hypothetical protein
MVRGVLPVGARLRHDGLILQEKEFAECHNGNDAGNPRHVVRIKVTLTGLRGSGKDRATGMMFAHFPRPPFHCTSQ